jgi:hypothetical protein
VQSTITLPPVPFLDRIVHASESPSDASLQVISKSPLTGPLDSIPINTHIIYLMTNSQPSRNPPPGAFQPSSTKLSIPRPFPVCPKLVPLNQCNCFIWCLSFGNECVSSWTFTFGIFATLSLQPFWEIPFVS